MKASTKNSTVIDFAAAKRARQAAKLPRPAARAAVNSPRLTLQQCIARDVVRAKARAAL